MADSTIAETKQDVMAATSDDTLQKQKKQSKKSIQKEKEALEEKTRERLSRAKEAYRRAYDTRRRYDFEWMTRDLFRRGYQFTRYNPQNNSVIISQRKATHIPINITAAYIRAIRNQVTAFKPKWEVMPTPGEENTENARFGERLLDNYWRKYRLNKMVKETVTQGLLYSVGGPWQITWDDSVRNDDGTYGDVRIQLVDPFDFYIDPNCTDGLTFKDAEYVIKAVRTATGEIKANPVYNEERSEVGGDSRIASSEYKQFLLQTLKFLGQTNKDENETNILFEGYFKERDDETGETKIRVLHWVETSVVPLYEEVLDTDDFPFRVYQADMNPLEVYGEGWARHVIAVNRILNALESSGFDYNYRYAKGRFVIDKNSGVRLISNEHGSIIEKNRGSQVSSLPLDPLPSNFENQISRIRQYLEDIGGVHDPSLGRVPAGVKSGIGLAELKQGDASNQQDLVDQLEDFLIEVGRLVLRVYAENSTIPQIVKHKTQNGRYEYFAAVGRDAYNTRYKGKTEYAMGESKYKIARINPDNELSVTIGSWLAYSKEQQRNELKDLYKMNVIDQNTLLEHLEFPNVDDIVKKSRQEAMLKNKQAQPSGSSPQINEEQLATEENNMMLEGRTDVVPQPHDDHQVHLIVHQQALGQGADPIVQKHMQEHVAMAQRGQEQGMANNPVA